jgi:serine/threonine protein kinase
MTDFQPGDLLDGRFALEERIGLGGMASVWRATDRADGGFVAVKVLREDFLRRNPKEADNNVRRFKREAEILKLLAGSPHVVGLKSAGTAPTGHHYLVMELLRGEPLRDHVPRTGRRIGLRTYAWLARGLVAGLDEIHRRGVLHRDLSPDNVFVVRDAEGLPVPKFLDFGIGKGSDGRLDQVTQLVTIMGKPQYFSPEQARGGELAPSSDVYALCVVLYELATGELPIDLKSLPLVAAVKRILSEDCRSTSARWRPARACRRNCGRR